MREYESKGGECRTDWAGVYVEFYDCAGCEDAAEAREGERVQIGVWERDAAREGLGAGVRWFQRRCASLGCGLSGSRRSRRRCRGDTLGSWRRRWGSDRRPLVLVVLVLERQPQPEIAIMRLAVLHGGRILQQRESEREPGRVGRSKSRNLKSVEFGQSLV